MKAKFLKNGIWLYSLQLVNTVLPLLTIPYITRILGPSNYGVFSLALNIVGYMQVVVEYGFGMSASRKAAIYSKDNEWDKLGILFPTIVYSRLIIFGLCGGVLWIVTAIALWNTSMVICIWVLFLGLIGYCFQQNWFFQGIQEMKYIAIVSILSRTASVIMIFALVNSSKDVLLYSVLYSVSPILNGFLGTYFAVKKYGMRFRKITVGKIIEEIKAGWNVFTTQLSAKVFGGIGVTFLGLLSTDYYVGIYSAIQKIPNVMMLCWSPISQVLYPASSKIATESFISGKKRIFKIRRIILLIAVLGVTCVSFASSMLVTFILGEEYGAYSKIVIPLLWWVVLGINNNFLGIQLLLGGGYDKEYSKCFQISVIFTIIANYGLIMFLGIEGAAYAPILSEGVLSILLWREIRKIEKVTVRNIEYYGEKSGKSKVKTYRD